MKTSPKTLYELSGIDSYGFDGPGEKEGRDKLLQEIAERDEIIKNLKEKVKKLENDFDKRYYHDGK